MLQLIESLELVTWTSEMEDLAAAYIRAGVFSGRVRPDAQHAAACTVAGIPVMVSWNFRHLVNRNRRIRINLLNAAAGYNQIEIVTPAEL